MGFSISRDQFIEVGEKLRQVVDPALTTIFGVDQPSTRNAAHPHYSYLGTACSLCITFVRSRVQLEVLGNTGLDE